MSQSNAHTGRSSGRASTGFPSFTRALSPALAGTVLADQALGTISERKAAALGMAKSLDDVVMTIPFAYREVLRIGLRATHDDAERRVDVRGQLERLRQHKAAAGTLPPDLASVKVPAFQLSKAYKESAEALQPFVELALLWTQYTSAALDFEIKAKEAELAFYESRLQPEVTVQRLLDAVHAHWNDHISPTARVCQLGDKHDAQGNVIGTEITGWAEDAALKQQCVEVCTAVPRMLHVVVNLVYSRAITQQQRNEAKRVLKDQADVEMGEAALEDTTTRLQKELEKLRLDMNKLSRPTQVRQYFLQRSPPQASSRSLRSRSPPKP